VRGGDFQLWLIDTINAFILHSTRCGFHPTRAKQSENDDVLVVLNGVVEESHMWAGETLGKSEFP